ncbi:Cadherins are calcium-dependent cell adhesion protein [Desmophyllum pertusum]|uniref:Cadherins are calcium-dependent cell adhesion protein n=1 Tax=Desmophyllum pertusum TaxID=174260 RepID=A0A9W9ZQI7_9CNID|nr:Cadherins are calcium-dependent cell adhesion protein [Desmophyllum pertusum]
MTAILKNSRPSLSKAMAAFEVVVLVVGVDECLYEPCESGGCTNVLIANGEVEVISVKGASFASIVAILEPRCDNCDAHQTEMTSCELKPCLNGGTCEYIPEGYVCRCVVGFDGPNCEFTTRSFDSGEWLWLPPLSSAVWDPCL